MSIHDAVASAEVAAQLAHDQGVCHLSEWSCSACEADPLGAASWSPVSA